MTPKMTTAQVVETSVTVTNSSFQNYTHPDDHTRQTIKHFTAFVHILYFFRTKKGKPRIFRQKWPHHLLLMTSYLVTISTDAHQSCAKMCVREMRTATEKFKEKLMGDFPPPPPPMYARGLIIAGALTVSFLFRL